MKSAVVASTLATAMAGEIYLTIECENLEECADVGGSFVPKLSSVEKAIAKYLEKDLDYTEGEDFLVQIPADYTTSGSDNPYVCNTHDDDKWDWSRNTIDANGEHICTDILITDIPDDVVVAMKDELSDYMYDKDSRRPTKAFHKAAKLKGDLEDYDLDCDEYKGINGGDEPAPAPEEEAPAPAPVEEEEEEEEEEEKEEPTLPTCITCDKFSGVAEDADIVCQREKNDRCYDRAECPQDGYFLCKNPAAAPAEEEEEEEEAPAPAPVEEEEEEEEEESTGNGSEFVSITFKVDTMTIDDKLPKSKDILKALDKNLLADILDSYLVDYNPAYKEDWYTCEDRRDDGPWNGNRDSVGRGEAGVGVCFDFYVKDLAKTMSVDKLKDEIQGYMYHISSSRPGKDDFMVDSKLDEKFPDFGDVSIDADVNRNGCPCESRRRTLLFGDVVARRQLDGMCC